MAGTFFFMMIVDLLLLILIWPIASVVFELQPIPTKFSKNLKKKLPEIVTLKGPSGSAWKVELTTSNDTMFFKHGWADFVKDHFLQEKDLLIFKYNGDSHFDVLMFDGQSMCEKTASYFVRKCGHRERHSACQTKRKFGESSIEVIRASPQDFVGGTPEKCATNQLDTPPLGQPIISQATNKETRREIKFNKPIHTRQNLRFEESSTSSEEIETKPGRFFIDFCCILEIPTFSSLPVLHFQGWCIVYFEFFFSILFNKSHCPF